MVPLVEMGGWTEFVATLNQFLSNPIFIIILLVQYVFDKLKKLQIYQEIHQFCYVAVPMRTEVDILARGNRGEK